MLDVKCGDICERYLALPSLEYFNGTFGIRELPTVEPEAADPVVFLFDSHPLRVGLGLLLGLELLQNSSAGDPQRHFDPVGILIRVGAFEWPDTDAFILKRLW